MAATAAISFGNFEAVLAGERAALKLLVLTLPHSNARYARACMSQRSECVCDGLAGRRRPPAATPRGAPS